MKVLVSGANGLVGRALCPLLEQAGHEVRRVVRSSATSQEVEIGEINASTDWSVLLTQGIEAVVHLAARVHVMHTESIDAYKLYRDVNTLGTLKLAQQCAASGVKRFVFVSTVKVHGEGRAAPYQSSDSPVPEGAYAISKWEAEQGLQEIAAQTGMEVVILRPPLVYGPGVGANLLRLIRAIDLGFPLPLGAVANRRSLIYLGNLIEAISVCLTHPIAAGKTYLLSDGEDVSTPQLVQQIAAALGRPARLLPVSLGVIKFVGCLLGKKKEMERLLGNLSVDSSPIQNELAWAPPYTMRAGLTLTTEWYSKAKFLMRR
ncbi:MAG TPA: NAD-dependent dehydratase [Oxalobacteraceae bacterium]|nr:NAD-dependent dehydratase [Oxalobacteraceae bacterium]